MGLSVGRTVREFRDFGDEGRVGFAPINDDFVFSHLLAHCTVRVRPQFMVVEAGYGPGKLMAAIMIQEWFYPRKREPGSRTPSLKNMKNMIRRTFCAVVVGVLVFALGRDDGEFAGGRKWQTGICGSL